MALIPSLRDKEEFQSSNLLQEILDEVLSVRFASQLTLLGLLWSLVAALSNSDTFSGFLVNLTLAP